MQRKWSSIFVFAFIVIVCINSMALSYWPRPEVFSISTNKGNNNEVIELTIKGDKFANSVLVKLTRYDQPEFIATNIRVISKKEIICTLDLRGKPPGVWDITIVNMHHFMFFTQPKLVIFLKRFTIEYPAPVTKSIKPDRAAND